MVIPVQISYTNSYYAVKLQSTFNSASIAGYLSSFVGSIVTGGISGITARVVGYADATTTDEPTLYVKYLTTATNSASSTGTTGASVANATYEFVNGESLAADKTISSFNAGSNSVTLITTGATQVVLLLLFKKVFTLFVVSLFVYQNKELFWTNIQTLLLIVLV